MKNKKIHLLLLIISSFLLLFLLIFEIVYFMFNKDDIELVYVFSCILMNIWISCFPISFFTCWRILNTESGDNHMFYKVVHIIYGGIGGGVFLFPFIISPFLIPDYIIFFKQDRKRSSLFT